MSGNYNIVEANYLRTVVRRRGDKLLWGGKLDMA